MAHVCLDSYELVKVCGKSRESIFRMFLDKFRSKLLIR